MELSIVEFMSIGIVGAAVSLFVETLKKYYPLQSNNARIITIAVSVVAGALLWALQQNAVLWQNILAILASATTIYSVFIKAAKDREDV